jgi:hypothetical protein
LTFARSPSATTCLRNDFVLPAQHSRLGLQSVFVVKTAELSPPAFRTFRRKLSSVWQAVSHPRTARKVLEKFTGVTERRMIVP